MSKIVYDTLIKLLWGLNRVETEWKNCCENGDYIQVLAWSYVL